MGLGDHLGVRSGNTALKALGSEAISEVTVSLEKEREVNGNENRNEPCIANGGIEGSSVGC